MNNLLSQEEVKSFLEVEDGEVDRLVQGGRLHAYKIGGTYLRFRKEEVLTIKQDFNSRRKPSLSISWFVRLWDFWRFNNFYIVSLLVVAALFFFVIRS